MNNQAAQTMPEPIAAMIEQVSSVESLIDDAIRQYHDSTRWAEEPSVYDDRSSPTLQEAIDAGFNKLRDMLRDYAAALAAPKQERPHPDALPDGTLSKSTAKRVEALAAASVSERALDDLHVAICQAVALMNMEPMTTAGLLQAHDILRKAIS